MLQQEPHGSGPLLEVPHGIEARPGHKVRIAAAVPSVHLLVAIAVVRDVHAERKPAAGDSHIPDSAV